MSLLVLRNTSSLCGAIFCSLANFVARAAYALGRVIRRNKRVDRSGVIWGCAVQLQQGITVPPVTELKGCTECQGLHAGICNNLLLNPGSSRPPLGAFNS
jgi:hypothetical protein